MQKQRYRFGLNKVFSDIARNKPLTYTQYAESALAELVLYIQSNPQNSHDVFKSIALIISKLPDHHKYEAARLACIPQKSIDMHNNFTEPLDHGETIIRRTMLNDYNREMNKIAAKFKSNKSFNFDDTMDIETLSGTLSAQEFVTTLKHRGWLNFKPALGFEK